MQQATPEENKELKRAYRAVSKAIYDNDKMHDTIIRTLSKDNKVGSVAAMAAKVIKLVDEKIDIDEGVIAGLIPAVVDNLVELMAKAKGIEMTDGEVKQALGVATETILLEFGVDPADYQEFARQQGMDNPQARQQASQFYEGLINEQ